MPASEQLLDKLLDYFLKHGVANLSLRPLAKSAGTSARMLVHHFGSKEGLIAAVMNKGRGCLQHSFESFAIQASGSDPGELMLAFWKLTTSKRYRPYLRLLFEVQILAMQNPKRYRQYLADTSTTWIRLLQTALPPSSSKAAMATLCMTVIDGLLLEYLSTGDLRRTSKALDLFLVLLSDSPSGLRHPTRRGKQKR
jgi:AcrR family transcriptional regulator